MLLGRLPDGHGSGHPRFPGWHVRMSAGPDTADDHLGPRQGGDQLAAVRGRCRSGTLIQRPKGTPAVALEREDDRAAGGVVPDRTSPRAGHLRAVADRRSGDERHALPGHQLAQTRSAPRLHRRKRSSTALGLRAALRGYVALDHRCSDPAGTLNPGSCRMRAHPPLPAGLAIPAPEGQWSPLWTSISARIPDCRHR